MKKSQQRIDNIDLLKGVTMIATVWLHTTHPHFINLIPVNALFFIISGTFFRNESFSLFFKKKVQTLLIPFLTFYLFSYLFRIGIYGIKNQSIQGFHWETFLDLFTISNTCSNLSINIPLWFLLCLFIMQWIFWILHRIIPNKYHTTGFLLLLIGLYIAYPYIIYWETPFMLNTTLENLPFFIFGNLFGLSIAQYLENTPYRYIVAIASLTLFILLQILSIDWGILLFIQAISLYIGLLAFLSYFSNQTTPISSIIRNIGKSTLLILGLHVLILSIIQTIIYTIWGKTLLSGITCLLSTLTIIYFLTPFFNHYLPWVVGKKRSTPHKE